MRAKTVPAWEKLFGMKVGEMGAAISESLRDALWAGYQGQGAMRNDPYIAAAKRLSSLIGRQLTREEAIAFWTDWAKAKGEERQQVGQSWVERLKPAEQQKSRDDEINDAITKATEDAIAKASAPWAAAARPSAATPAKLPIPPSRPSRSE